MGTDMQRFQMIFTNEEIARITKLDDHAYEVDLHGEHRDEAKRFLNNLINVTRHPFVLSVVHGYNHGTVLQEMVRTDFDNPRVVSMNAVPFNQGETVLCVA